MDFDRPKSLTMTKFPEGNFMVWTDSEAARCEAHARAFALEYVKDYDGVEAAVRLGFEFDQAKSVAKNYLRHWLVQSYIDQLEAKFADQAIGDASRLRALVWRDAGNFRPGTNAMARVNAQKLYADLIGEGASAKKAAAASATVPLGGVMVIQGLSPAEWEARAAESQAKLKEDVRK